MSDFDKGISVFTKDILMDGLTDLWKLDPTWKTQYVGILVLFSAMFIGFAFLAFTGSDTFKFAAKFIFWLIFTMAVIYPFLYWVDTSGFWSALTFFIYFLVTYSVLGGERGRASIAANLIAATILFGAILWYYTWDMTIWWLRRIGLWLFLFNLIIFGGFKSAIESEEKKGKVLAIGFFMCLFFVLVIYFGYSFMDQSQANTHWEGVKPIWK